MNQSIEVNREVIFYGPYDFVFVIISVTFFFI